MFVMVVRVVMSRRWFMLLFLWELEVDLFLFFVVFVGERVCRLWG